MKKGTILGLILAIGSLIALGALAVYLTILVIPDLMTANTPVSTDVEESIFVLYEETEVPAEKPAKAKDKTATTDSVGDSSSEKQDTAANNPSYIWVGDSRTVGMGRAVDNSDIYIGESGEGYYWLDETGLPLIIEAIVTYPELPVIFNFGVNDDENLDNYLLLYRALEEQYPETDFYYLSVNPIEPTLCTNISNEEIAAFNLALKETFPDTYIDSFTFLMVNETVTIDGIHYSEDDYRTIYDYTVAQIERMNP